MKAITLGLLAATTLLAGCGDYGSRPGNAGGNRWSQYDYDRPDPTYNGYYADRYYRDGSRYRERRLSRNERIYVGQDGRYYCRRSDGTTGLIIGGLAGGALGTAIAPGGSGLLGALLGGAAGAAAGQAIDRNNSRDNVRCR